jgi:PAS domain S-box-containing protein
LDDHERNALARLTLLARVGEILGSGLQRQDTLHRVAELLAPGLATWCVFDVADLEGVLVQRVSVPGDVPLPQDAPHGPAIVTRTGEPELVRDAQRFGLCSMLCVPLTAGAQTLGALTLLSADQAYGTFEVELASEIARRIATAIQGQRSAERYRMLFEASPMPMWVYDAATLSFLAVNDAAVRHYGYRRDEFLRMRITDIRPPEDVAALLDDVKARGGPGSPNAKVWRHVRKDGSVISVEITAGRIMFEGRKAALVIAHDVTDRLRLEQRLAEAEKMEAIGRLAGGVAHDFNNLLTVIAGYAEILEARQPSEEAAEISRAAAQAAALTHQLLAFSRRQVLHPRLVDLNQIVSAMETMLQRIIGDDISVGIRLDPALAAVEADRAQLERVILNLAANARDAMPNGGVLKFATQRTAISDDPELDDGDYVELTISDTGTGMPEEVAARAFEPFFTTKEIGKGTGLGLSMVYGMARQSGGTARIESAPGEGAAIRMFFKAAATRAESEEAANDEERPETGQSDALVLVIDDDPDVRGFIAEALAEDGFRVRECTDGRKGLKHFKEDKPDLVVLDFVMPAMSGADVARAMLDQVPDQKILFVSGYSETEAIKAIAPNSPLLSKPFRSDALCRAVRNALNG